MIRKAIFGVLAVLAVVSFFGPLIIGKADTAVYGDKLRDAILDEMANSERTSGAPQQQVVNGWVARDLLIIQTQQQNDMLELQYRQMALLLTIALILGWGFATQQQRVHDSTPLPQPVGRTEGGQQAQEDSGGGCL